MSDPRPTRPERIASMREAMAELDRARLAMRTALRESNDERHHAFFPPLLDRLGLIVANERDGITFTLANDLANARSALRRLRLSDIDPGLEAQTPALLAVRGGRGNLIEALDNALDAADAIGQHPRAAALAGIRVERREIAEQLIRLDERLQTIEEGVADLREAALRADAASSNLPVQQAGLVNVYVRTLDVQVSAAKFETRIDLRSEAAGDTDMTALSRSIEAIHEVAGDLREAVDALSAYMTEGVRAAGRVVIKAADRSWRGWRAVVRTIRQRLTRDVAPPPLDEAAASAEAPPPDFDLDTVHAMIFARPGSSRVVAPLDHRT